MNIMNIISSHLIAMIFVVSVPVAHAEQLPRPDHVVVVIEENRGYEQIVDKLNINSYIHALAMRGALFTQSYAVAHPSQPNYLALFDGHTHGITNNACPNSFDSDNLATRLLDKGLTFASFAESLPEVGDVTCMFGAYHRKHNPVSNWQNTRVAPVMNKRFADFPEDFSKLPTISFVIPDQDNDMHDGSFKAADDWLKTRIAPYVDWAMEHNSLLVLTWDEDNYQADNHIVTILVGPMVKQGRSAQRISHYSVLRTLLDFYDLPALGASQDTEAISGVWINP
jgi:phosphatidylinositol-3-phosphatase